MAHISKNVNELHERQLTKGERLSDALAKFAGSWTFITFFALTLIVWMSVNSIALIKHFDPYPFILLNLVLSCLAAIQAPVIMMSQHRQEDRDRIRAQTDFEINIKAEREIELLHQKIDRLTAVVEGLASTRTYNENVSSSGGSSALPPEPA